MINGLTLVDLFSGVGGFSLGFEMSGAHPAAAIESNERHAQDYLRNRASRVRMFATSIVDVSATEIIRATGIRKYELDFLIGGPPCQPFSTAGKRNGTLDKRGGLIEDFIRFVRELQPRIFVMENVVGLQSIHDGDYLKRIVDGLRKSGYRCRFFILNAADYGVPQRRRRLFIVGSRLGWVDLSFPIPTHGALLGPMFTLPHVTVRDAISDLPYVSLRDRETDDSTLLPYSASPNTYQRKLRGRRKRVSGNGVTRHLPHILAAISPRALPEGAVHPSTRYRRLRWDEPCVTLRAGSGSFTALRPIHPTESRVITIREAARLQSFPDWYQFAPQKKHAYQQIGNSVPPLLARALADHLVTSLLSGRAATQV